MSSEYDKRAAILVSLRAGRNPPEIADFLKLPRSLIYRVKSDYDAASENQEEYSASRKEHSRRSDCKRSAEFVDTVSKKIEENPGKSMRNLAKEMGVHHKTISKTVKDDLEMKSYALRTAHLLTEPLKESREFKAAALLNNMKHETAGLLRFFSDEKNFDQDQKINRRNDRWICRDPEDVPIVMHTKFPASIMVLGVVSSDGDVMPPHFFETGLRLNADKYIDVLATVVKPWMDAKANGRDYVFQQDSAPAHKAKKTQAWLTMNVPYHWSPDLWPPSSPDCNPLDYYVWGVVEREVNKSYHNTLHEVKIAITAVMQQLDKDVVAKSCHAFRSRLEAVVAAKGGHIE
jgi:inhibitor of nuclear factor kappa-B kinase subunit alpha